MDILLNVSWTKKCLEMVFDASSYVALQLRQLLHGGGVSSGEERPGNLLI